MGYTNYSNNISFYRRSTKGAAFEIYNKVFSFIQ